MAKSFKSIQKKLLAVFLTLAMAVGMLPAVTLTAKAASTWSSLSDTGWFDNNPTASSYTISSAAQLAGLAQLVNNGNVFLNKTINLSASIDLSGHAWTPIGLNTMGFCGTFNGNGHVISSMAAKVTDPYVGEVMAGLFGTLNSNGFIKNLGVTGTAEADNQTANVDTYAGGLAAVNSGVIFNCYSQVIATSAATGDGSKAYAGSLVGHELNSIYNCYATGNANSSAPAGANAGVLVGLDDGYTSNCYYNSDAQVTGTTIAKGGTAETSDEMKGADLVTSLNQNNYYAGSDSLDMGAVWVAVADGYPTFQNADTTPPSSPTYSPSNGMTCVAVNIKPTLTFSEALYSSASGTAMAAAPTGIIKVYEGTSSAGRALTEGTGTDNSHYTVAYDSSSYKFTVTFGADLKYNQSYYVELQANKVYDAAGNPIRSTQGVTFKTPTAPTVTTGTAGGITCTAATLNGTVNANNDSTTVTFEYGTTTNYGSIVYATPSSVYGSTATSVSCSLTELAQGTTYHYRVSAVNGAGTTNGDDATFTTSTPPTVSSINRLTPANEFTNATSVTYCVTFSDSVSNVDKSDFALTKTGKATGTIDSVSASSGTTIDVTVNSVSGDGTLRLDLNSSGTGITDAAGPISGGYTSGQTYTIDNTAPTVGGVFDGGLFNVTVSAAFSDANTPTAMLKKDTDAAAAYTSGTEISAEGNYILTVTDAAGNTTTVSFTIDKTPPAVSDIENGHSYNHSVAATFTEGTATLSKDGGTAEEYKSGNSISQDGSYVLVVTDAARNPNTVIFTIDTTAPVLSAVSASSVTDSGATLNFTSGEAGTYYYLVYKATDTAPTATVVTAQVTAVAKGYGSALAAANTATITGLSASTAYTAYIVVEDAVGNPSLVSTASINTTAPQSTAPAAGNIAVTNNLSGTSDTVVVNSLAAGDVVKVYSAASGGTLLGTSSAVASGSTSATVTIAQLGSSAGTVYVTVTSTGKLESARTAKAYAAEPDTAPNFTGKGGVLIIPVNSGAADVKNFLHANDPDNGQTITWTLLTMPQHGTVNVTGATASSGSTDITPGGTITYTPAAGYSGTDSFDIQISDGTLTKTQTVNISVEQQVAKPTASAAGAAVTSGTQITLSTATSGAAIYYTTNGSTPTTSSTLYTGAITVTNAMTIKAIAVKTGMINSDVMSESYTIAFPIPTPTPTPTPTPSKVDVNVGGTTDPATGTTTSPVITPADTNTNKVNNVIVKLDTATVTAPAQVLNDALGGDPTSTLRLTQTTPPAAVQQTAAAIAAANNATSIGVIEVDLTRYYSNGSSEPVHQLSGNITVTIKLTPEQIAQIQSLSNPHLYYYDPQTNTVVDVKAVFDLTTGTATFEVNHLSTFVIAAGAPATKIGVSYSTHVQKTGWQKNVTDGALSGTTGKALRLEAIKINLTGNVPAGAKITYQAHVQKIGWQKPVSNGAVAGTSGKSLRVEALKITLSGLEGYQVRYRVYVQGRGWMSWQVSKNGTSIDAAGIAGTTGKNLRIEAIEVVVEKIPS